MKFFLLFCLVSFAGLVSSYPRPDGRVLRRRNGVLRVQANPAEDFAAAGYEPETYERQLQARKNLKQRKYPQAAAEASYRPVPYPSRRQQVDAEEPAISQPEIVIDPATPEVSGRDSAPSQSNAYGAYDSGSYDAEQLKFEQSVQNSASSYNPDKGVDSGRLNFAIHGQQGPNSYRFGYDTGKGNDRVFRYEERDAEGVVHGRYGYYDQTGKLRIVNYTAHPKHGFQAEGNFGPK